MRNRSKLWFVFVFIFLVASYGYYNFDFTLENHSLFLSLSTFLFAIFSGFFISRQSTRYSNLTTEISRFDGGVTFVYRTSGVLGKRFQDAVGKIIKRHYDKILRSGEWDYPLTHKTTTMTDILEVFVKFSDGKGKLKGMQASAFGSLGRSFAYMQIARKKMDILHQERIPALQWGLLIFLAGILLISVSAITSVGMFIPALLKGAFATCILLVLVILYQFNNLTFFENIIGEHSAKDVLDIMGGKR